MTDDPLAGLHDEEDPDGPRLGGRLLIAMPGIGDPRFERAVILVTSHSPDEATGITVNRPLEGLSLAELLSRLGVRGPSPAPDHAVLIGGPVERERGFVVHTDDYISGESTLPVGDGLALTATRDVLEAMGDAARRPRQAVLALGCAEWSAGQLDDEMRENVWLICEPDDAIVFDEDYATKWERALAKIGVAPGRLSSLAGHA